MCMEDPLLCPPKNPDVMISPGIDTIMSGTSGGGSSGLGAEYYGLKLNLP